MARAPPNYRNRNRKNQRKHQFDLRLCVPYLYQQDGCKKDENKCDFLHICRNYILKKCRAGGQCPFSHDLQSRQTRDLFQRRFGISPLEGESLQTFKELFAATLVKPTVDESLGDEEAKIKIAELKQKNQKELEKYLRSCPRRSSLPSSQRKPSASDDANPLPVQKATAQSPEDPQLPSSRRKPSNNDATPLPVQKATAQSPEDPQLPSSRRKPSNNDATPLTVQEATAQSPHQPQPLICAFYLKGSCRYTEDMYEHRNVKHCTKPYQWQIKQEEHGDWLNFREEFNNLVEKKYCDVTCSQYTGKIIAQSESNVVSFESLEITFSGDALEVTDQRGCDDVLNIRRLSTASYAVAKKQWQKTNCTHWTWYMYRIIGYMGNWYEFDEKASPEGDEDSDITSLILEKFYLTFKNKKGPSVFERSVHQFYWHIDFTLMKCWINITDQRKVGPWAIARRPGKRRPSEPVVRPKEVPLQQQRTHPAKSNERPSSSRPSSSPNIPSLLTLPTSSKPAPVPGKQKEFVLICPYFLRGGCKFDADKYRHRRHFPNPYQWQYMDGSSGESDWQDFSLDENDSIEKSFCDVSISLCSCQSLPYLGVSVTIRFDEKPMKCAQTGFRFRRLATSSSIDNEWETAFCTEWKWYWCDETGTWNLYSDEGAKGTRATTDSASIEEQFQEFERGKLSESVISFRAGEQEYKLDFTAMHQTNIRYGTVRQVRRRPKFLSMLERKQLSRALSRAPSSGIVVPGTWNNHGTKRDLVMKLVPLKDATTYEYRDIATLFEKTMNKGCVVSVERVQNTELWEDFAMKRERMKKKNGGTPVKEMRLFHGTSTQKEVDAICHQNFDWRLSGTKVGAIHGKGSYFARDASFAHSYTQLDRIQRRYVMVAQVLVGTYINGDPTYTRPPPKDPSKPYGDLYDSCVDDMLNPRIHIVFEKAQVYPEYVITYKDKPMPHSTVTARSSNQVPYRTPAQAQSATPQASTSYSSTSASAISTPIWPPTQPPKAASSTQPIPSYQTSSSSGWNAQTSSSYTQPKPSYPASSFRNAQPPSPTPPKDKGCTIQ